MGRRYFLNGAAPRVACVFFASIATAGCYPRNAGPVDFDMNGGGTTISSTGDPDDLGIEQSCCMKGAHGPFEGPAVFLLSTPDEPNDRTCEDVGLSTAFTAYADPTAPPAVCPACECSPASCKLPEEMHASAAKCAGGGAASVQFDAAPGWEGTCDSSSAVPANAQCNGADCVQSLTFSGLTLEPCKPTPVGDVVAPPVAWGTAASRCSGKSFTQDGCGADKVCVPSVPEGAALCLWGSGVLACDDEQYPRRLIVYANPQDERACSPCACGDPQGAECTAFLSVFEDAACSMLLVTEKLGLDQPLCTDLLPGSALGSKGAFFQSDKPGKCEPSGGDAVGDVQLGDPLTLCCPLEPPPLE